MRCGTVAKAACAGLLLLTLIGCATSSQAKTTPTATTFPHTTINPTTLTGKLMMGYQGWFGCPNDGSQLNDWVHWLKATPAVAANIRVDMWPDTAELDSADRCPTQMTLPDGSPAYLYSAYSPKTILRHFQWMAQYGVDGVMLQRFTSTLTVPALGDHDNRVAQNVMNAAQATGRVFNMMYDITGEDAATFVPRIEADWKYLVDTLKVTQSPQYLHHAGKPVLALWGIGFTDRPGTPAQAMELLNFFEHNPDPRYQVTLLGGVPTYWRTLTNDALPDPGYANYYCALNVISPWTVGRYASDIEIDQYASQVVTPDVARAKQCGAQYMPVVYPGTSFHNSGGTPLNLVPRRGGRFYWRQVYDFLSAGATMLYNAMFDEVDEGTAMYKTAATAASQPTGASFVSLDSDGEAVPSDWYLRLAGEASKLTRHETPLTAKMPFLSAPAVGSYPIQIRVATTSDWTNVTLLDGGEFVPMEVTSYSPGISAGWTGPQFHLNQPPGQQGVSIEVVARGYLRNVTAASTLRFRIERGAIGSSTLELAAIVGGNPVVVQTFVWSGNPGGLNPADFTVSAKEFIS
jgi:hypothetical protein